MVLLNVPEMVSVPPELPIGLPAPAGPALRLRAPEEGLTVPLLLKATLKLLVPAPAVLLSEPELLKVEGRPPLLVQLESFWTVKEPLLLKVEPLVRKTPPLPDQITVP